jgi:ribosomal protein S25
MCGSPVAVADLASETGLPLGVVQILLSDLHQQGMISLVRPAREHIADEDVLRKVLDGLRAL